MKHNTKKTTRIHDTQKRHMGVTAPAPPTCTKHQKRYTCICRNIYQHFQFFQQQAQKRYVCCRHCLQDLPILQLVGKKTYVHEQINFQNLAPFMYVQKSNTPNNGCVLTCLHLARHIIVQKLHIFLCNIFMLS